MNKRNTLYLGVALAIAILVGYGVARVTQPAVPTPPITEENTPPRAANDAITVSDADIASLQIDVADAASGELDAAVAASASVEAAPDAEAVLTSRAPGVVTRIFKRIGDTVVAGDTIALVESRDAATIASERAAAAARVTLAQRSLARERQLVDQGVSARADYERAQAELAVAQADAQRAVASAAGARVTRDGRSVAVVSPISGRVTVASANLGQYVSAEADLFHIADPRRLQVLASLPSADATRVREGDRAELMLANGRVVQARVLTATGVVDPQSRAVTAVLEPVGSHEPLVPGQLLQARVYASADAEADSVMVPQEAVQTLGDRTVVFVRTRTGFKAQPVQAGRGSGGLLPISAGLKPGTPIATTNAFLLKAELEKETAE